jgi:pantetheine-phosphate adenylyltransferase
MGVYAGTFDPLTLGHEDVIRRAATLFDTLIVAVATAHHKTTWFDLAQRVALAQASLADMPHVKIMPFDGLLVQFCHEQGAQTLVKGIRNGSDLDHESQLSALNQKLDANVTTIFLMANPAVQCLSSTLVREVAKLRGPLHQLVNPAVAKALQAKTMSF